MQNADNLEDPQSIPQISPPIVGPNPNDPPWTLPLALGIWILSILAIIFAPLVLVIPYYLIKGGRMPADPATDPTVIILSLIAIIPAHLFTLLVCYPVVTKGMKLPFFATLGWRLGNFRWWHFVAVLLGLFIAMSGITALFPEQDNQLLQILRSSPAAAYVMAALATVFAPFVEELVYRGILYPAVERAVGIVWAVAIVTALFAGIHFLQYWGSPGSLMGITLLSLILTSARAISGNLLPSVILHLAINGLQSIAIVYATMNGGIDAPAAAFFR